MKRLLTFIVLAFLAISAYPQAVDIADARNESTGTTVTVSGIVTNGSELGTIRYMQDETAGIAIYNSDFAQDIARGDSVTVTGPLTEYNHLLEMDVDTFTVHSSDNPLPEPVILTPAQLSEQYEAQLATIENVSFEDAGSSFQANTSYSFTANGESAEIYVRSDHPLIGTVIPSEPVNITGLVSQFSYDDPNAGYQIVLRGPNDIEVTSTIYLTSTPKVSNITKSGFDVRWTTNDAGATYLITGDSATALNDTIKNDEEVTDHTVSVTEKEPASIVYYKAMTFNDQDTTFSPIQVGATQSESTGEIKVYFTHETADSVATADTASTLNGTADDTLVNYINRAEKSIDMAVYNISESGVADIVGALNNAYQRGVDVRVITCGSNNTQVLDDLNSNIHTLERPDENDYGIMHNKFLAIDAHHSNPDKAFVWTGSTNLTSTNINHDANSILIIQDQSLAKAYSLEFEEMWGSTGNVPDADNARFGAAKTDNTPHEFIIGGSRVESYFSPSDNTNGQIINSIESADQNLSIKTMLITRSDLAYAIENAYNEGISTNMLTDNASSNSDFVEELLSEALTVHYVHDDLVDGMMHTKTMIADEGAPDSDPLVLTGSHNWSNSANEENDENTLIIHNDTIANLFFQSFTKRFLDNNGSFIELNEPPVAIHDTVNATPETDVFVSVLDNDELEGEVNLELVNEATHGSAYISFTDPTKIGYKSEAGFTGTDSVQYKIAYKTNTSLSDKAWIFFNVESSSHIAYADQINRMKIYPNPGQGMVNIEITNNNTFPARMQILNIQGKKLYEFNSLRMNAGKTTMQIDLRELPKGVYILKVISKNYSHTKKLFIR